MQPSDCAQQAQQPADAHDARCWPVHLQAQWPADAHDARRTRGIGRHNGKLMLMMLAVVCLLPGQHSIQLRRIGALDTTWPEMFMLLATGWLGRWTEHQLMLMMLATVCFLNPEQRPADADDALCGRSKCLALDRATAT